MATRSRSGSSRPCAAGSTTTATTPIRTCRRSRFRQWTPRELLETAFRHPLLFPPGSAFDYSNTNTVLLGLVVEKVSGQSLASFIQQNILRRLGMNRTVFPGGAEFPSPHAQGYFKLPDGKVADATDWNPSWGWASGNMISTLEDMRVWARDFAIGKLISHAMKRERDRFLPAPQEGDGALYGLAIENQNGWIGHNGNIMSTWPIPTTCRPRGSRWWCCSIRASMFQGRGR